MNCKLEGKKTYQFWLTTPNRGRCSDALIMNTVSFVPPLFKVNKGGENEMLQEVLSQAT